MYSPMAHTLNIVELIRPMHPNISKTDNIYHVMYTWVATRTDGSIEISLTTHLYLMDMGPKNGGVALRVLPDISHDYHLTCESVSLWFPPIIIYQLHEILLYCRNDKICS